MPACWVCLSREKQTIKKINKSMSVPTRVTMSSISALNENRKQLRSVYRSDPLNVYLIAFTVNTKQRFKYVVWILLFICFQIFIWKCGLRGYSIYVLCAWTNNFINIWRLQDNVLRIQINMILWSQIKQCLAMT